MPSKARAKENQKGMKSVEIKRRIEKITRRVISPSYTLN